MILNMINCKDRLFGNMKTFELLTHLPKDGDTCLLKLIDHIDQGIIESDLEFVKCLTDCT